MRRHLHVHCWEAVHYCALCARAGKDIAIEVDGPHHFTANTHAVLGEARARRKLLTHRGWAVISVPFFRWAGQEDAARAAWLLRVRTHALPDQAILLPQAQILSVRHHAHTGARACHVQFRDRHLIAE
jgi:hypothetical protein